MLVDNRWPAPAVLGAVEPHLAPVLVGDAQLAGCHSIARQLPFAPQSYYLECRLDASEQVDFLALTQSRYDLAQELETVAYPESARRAWPPTLSLLRGWAGEDPALADTELVWLEYDLDERLDQRWPVGSPSICLERGYLHRSVGPPKIDQQAGLQRAFAALRHLVEPNRRQLVANALTRCHAALPPCGSLVYLSETLTRDPCVTKLYVSLPKTEVLTFLRAIDWPGNLGDVSDILRQHYRDISETAFLDLSFLDRFTARLGFAFSQLHAREMQNFDPAWRWMPMAGVLAAKRAALSAWPGESEVRLRGARYNLVRWLDIKVVLDETRSLSHKAYLGFSPTFRRLR